MSGNCIPVEEMILGKSEITKDHQLFYQSYPRQYYAIMDFMLKKIKRSKYFKTLLLSI